MRGEELTHTKGLEQGLAIRKPSVNISGFIKSGALVKWAKKAAL